MKKVLAIVRVSTTIQETQGQKNDLIQFLQNKGFEESDIEWLEAKGASARKANKEYLTFIETIKEKTSGENGIKTVALWHLNRLGRIKYYLTEMEHWFVSNQIQMYVREGFDMPLLDENGRETLGASIAFSVYAALVEEETKEMMSKLIRGKRENAKIGKYNGGKIHFGYMVDENGRIVVNEEEAELIRVMYNLYASGQYSTPKLTKELQLRGYTQRSKEIKLHFVTNMLKTEAFIGKTVWNGIERPYPRIISDELFNAVQAKLNANFKGEITKQSKRINLCTKLIVCPTCGKHFYANDRSYSCINHKYHLQGIVPNVCTNDESISVQWVDTAALYVAKSEEMAWLYNMDETQKEEVTDKIKVNTEKIKTLSSLLQGKDQSIEEISIRALKGRISASTEERLIDELNEEYEGYEKEIASLTEENDRLSNLLAEYEGGSLISTERLLIRGIDEDREENRRLVLKHIKKISIATTEFQGKEQKLITITTHRGSDIRFIYVSKSKVKYGDNRPLKLYIEREGNGEFEPLMVDPEFILYQN